MVRRPELSRDRKGIYMEKEVPRTCSWQTGCGKKKKHLRTYAKEASRVCIWEPCGNRPAFFFRRT